MCAKDSWQIKFNGFLSGNLKWRKFFFAYIKISTRTFEGIFFLDIVTFSVFLLDGGGFLMIRWIHFSCLGNSLFSKLVEIQKTSRSYRTCLKFLCFTFAWHLIGMFENPWFQNASNPMSNLRNFLNLQVKVILYVPHRFSHTKSTFSHPLWYNLY